MSDSPASRLTPEQERWVVTLLHGFDFEQAGSELGQTDETKRGSIIFSCPRGIENTELRNAFTGNMTALFGKPQPSSALVSQITAVARALKKPVREEFIWTYDKDSLKAFKEIRDRRINEIDSQEVTLLRDKLDARILTSGIDFTPVAPPPPLPISRAEQREKDLNKCMALELLGGFDFEKAARDVEEKGAFTVEFRLHSPQASAELRKIMKSVFYHEEPEITSDTMRWTGNRARLMNLKFYYELVGKIPPHMTNEIRRGLDLDIAAPGIDYKRPFSSAARLVGGEEPSVSKEPATDEPPASLKFSQRVPQSSPPKPRASGQDDPPERSGRE